jgi:hypothetical protein
MESISSEKFTWYWNMMVRICQAKILAMLILMLGAMMFKHDRMVRYSLRHPMAISQRNGTSGQIGI